MSVTDHEHPIDAERVAHARARLPSAEDAARLTGLLSLMADPVRPRLVDVAVVRGRGRRRCGVERGAGPYVVRPARPGPVRRRSRWLVPRGRSAGQSDRRVGRPVSERGGRDLRGPLHGRRHSPSGGSSGCTSPGDGVARRRRVGDARLERAAGVRRSRAAGTDRGDDRHAGSTRRRPALLAHERSHLIHHHHLHHTAARLAVSVNPMMSRLPAAVKRATERWADEDAASVNRRDTVRRH